MSVVLDLYSQLQEPYELYCLPEISRFVFRNIAAYISDLQEFFLSLFI